MTDRLSGPEADVPWPEDYPVRRQHQTRWGDNDAYGHMNNAVHYAIADTAVNAWLVEATGLDTHALPAIGVVAESSCRYLRELRFPDLVDVGLAVERLGVSSITYRIGLFAAHHSGPAHALIRFVHVYVDRASRRPTRMPEAVRTAASTLSRSA